LIGFLWSSSRVPPGDSRGLLGPIFLLSGSLSEPIIPGPGKSTLECEESFPAWEVAPALERTFFQEKKCDFLSSPTFLLCVRKRRTARLAFPSDDKSLSLSKRVVIVFYETQTLSLSSRDINLQTRDSRESDFS